MDDASLLCTGCGLCCTSLFFPAVKIDANEADRLRTLGLPVEGDQFEMPCPKLEGTVCSIYGDRPRSCGRFSCTLLASLERQETSLADAQELVAEARRLYEALLDRFPDRSLPPRRDWDARVERWSKGDADDEDAPAILAFTMLNRFLDAHFRRSKR